MSLAIKQFNIVKFFLNKSIFDDNIIHKILIYYWNILDNKNKILLNWIDINKLNWNTLSRNKNAINLLEKNQDKINWGYLSTNPNAMHLLANNNRKIVWYKLSENSSIFKDEHIPII